MRTRSAQTALFLLLATLLFHSCAWHPYPTGRGAYGGQSLYRPPVVPEQPAAAPLHEHTLEWTLRPLSSEEFYALSESDTELSPEELKNILARLNARAPYHVTEDIRQGRPLKVPVNFHAYRKWEPLSEKLTVGAGSNKLIVIVKELPFLAWYANGRRVDDTYACIGREGEETRAGSFTVLEKDADHYSRSYNNSFGKPAWMPWALRIYGTVWIHAGDVTQAKCSHGCIILPMDKAQALYAWADVGTEVLIVDSLDRLP